MRSSSLCKIAWACCDSAVCFYPCFPKRQKVPVVGGLQSQGRWVCGDGRTLRRGLGVPALWGSAWSCRRGCGSDAGATVSEHSTLPGLGIIVPLNSFSWVLLFMFTSLGDWRLPSALLVTRAEKRLPGSPLLRPPGDTSLWSCRSRARRPGRPGDRVLSSGAHHLMQPRTSCLRAWGGCCLFLKFLLSFKAN